MMRIWQSLKKIDYERISMPDKAGYDILIDMREYG